MIFAMELFFGGISGTFQWRAIDAAMLALATIVLIGGGLLLLRLPIS